jgi:hypothetical protein
MSLALLRRAAAWVLAWRHEPVPGYVWLDTALLDTALLDTALLDTALLDTALIDTALIDTALIDSAPAGGADAAALSRLVAAVDPGSSGFAVSVAALVAWCTAYRVLTFSAPVTAVRIEPAFRGCGGLRVLTGVGDRVTLASPELAPELFAGADDVAVTVLAAIVETADRACRDLLHEAAALAQDRHDRR